MDYFMCFFFSVCKEWKKPTNFPCMEQGPGRSSYQGSTCATLENGTDLDTWSLLSLLSVQREHTGPIQKRSLPLSTGQHMSSL